MLSLHLLQISIDISPHPHLGPKSDQIFSYGMEPRSSPSCMMCVMPIIIDLKLRKRVAFSVGRTTQDIYCLYQYAAALRCC